MQFLRKKKKLETPIESQYLDAVTGGRIATKLWRSLALTATAVAIGSCCISSVLVVQLLKNLDRTKFILVPGLQKWTDAYPDEVTSEYIAGLWEHVAQKMSTWNYWNYKDNVEDLGKRFWSAEVLARHRENIRLTNFETTAETNKLSSLFRLEKEKSVYKWCAELQSACGYTTGIEYIYADGAPYQETEVSYFMLGDLTRPEKVKPYAVTITRVMRLTYTQAQAMLEAAEKGKLPAENMAIAEKSQGDKK